MQADLLIVCTKICSVNQPHNITLVVVIVVVVVDELRSYIVLHDIYSLSVLLVLYYCNKKN